MIHCCSRTLRYGFWRTGPFEGISRRDLETDFNLLHSPRAPPPPSPPFSPLSPLFCFLSAREVRCGYSTMAPRPISSLPSGAPPFESAGTCSQIDDTVSGESETIVCARIKSACCRAAVVIREGADHLFASVVLLCGTPNWHGRFVGVEDLREALPHVLLDYPTNS